MDEHGVNRGGIVGGLVLVMIGAAVLIGQLTGMYEVVVPMIGIAFLIAALFTRSYGFVVPGCILLGLGLGLIAEKTLPGLAEPVPLGLGLGFLSIWAIDQLFTRTVPAQGRWWPLIPGGILLFVGISGNVQNAGDYAPYVTGLALLVVGAVIIIRALMGRGSGTS